MSLSARSARWVLACALALPACQLFAPRGPTEVAQGRYYSTGNPDYDAFFIELHRLQVELKDAPERVAEPRAKLAQELDVGVDAEAIKEALSKRAADLASHQLKLSVERPSAEQPGKLRVNGTPSGDDAAFVHTLEDSIATLSELTRVIAQWDSSLQGLPEREIALEGRVDEAFVGTAPRKRSEIKNNLSDAQKILGILQGRLKDAARANAELVDAVAGALGEAPRAEKPSEAANTEAAGSDNKKSSRKSTAPAPERKPSKPAAPPAPKPKAPSREKPAPAAAPKPVAAPKPAPAEKPAPKAAPEKPAERSEVPPPPKPTPGTAKPDFEP